LIGTGTYIFARSATQAGIDPRKLVFAEDRGVDQIYELIVELSGSSSLVMGMANIAGVGLELVRYFANRSRLTAFK